MKTTCYRAIDEYFAAYLQRVSHCDDDRLFAAAALASLAVDYGHICLSLESIAGKRLSEALAWLATGKDDGPHLDSETDEDYRLPPLDDWISFLRSEHVAKVIDSSAANDERKPLVLSPTNNLYLHRYHHYETSLAAALLERAKPDAGHDQRSRQLATERLSTLFPRPSSNRSAIDWQALAAYLALRHRLLVISGGPGTGKTTTVARILALLQERQLGMDGDTSAATPLVIRLAAPTGKAAARLTESIKSAKQTPPCLPDGSPAPGALHCSTAIQAVIPEEASTIHRLLGTRRNSPYFRHGSHHKLTADIVVIDEASMVPLPLMAKLLAALRPETKLILLGDMDQLASVEPGYVLGDLCAAASIDHFSPDCAAEVAAVTAQQLPATAIDSTPLLADCTVRLVDSHRFEAGGTIDVVSRAINEATTIEEGQQALAALQTASADGTTIRCHAYIGDGAFPTTITDLISNAHHAYFSTRTPAEALAALDRFRILCAVRNGPHGVAALNRLVESRLGLGKTNRPGEIHYDHRPIMITRNDYGLGLFNGDVGVILDEDLPAMTGSPRVRRKRAWFRAADGTLRSFSPTLLPEHETCFAMTVHKSQGSEFERILLLLPQRPSPVVTKELVYTGLTRARQFADLLLEDESFVEACLRRTVSASGLFDRLQTVLS